MNELIISSFLVVIQDSDPQTFGTAMCVSERAETFHL